MTCALSAEMFCRYVITNVLGEVAVAAAVVSSSRATLGVSSTCQLVRERFLFKADWLLPLPIVWQHSAGELYPSLVRERPFKAFA